VLNTLSAKEIDVRTMDARCFRMRILPYRTLDNVIEGAVITFFDITEMRRTEDELRIAQAVLRDAKTVQGGEEHDGR
jgi:two-component system CheB/CheR fusion protein